MMTFLRIAQRLVMPAMILLAVMTSCHPEKYITDTDMILNKVRVETESEQIDVQAYKQYVRQRPKSRWFGLAKYPPVPYQELQTAMTMQDMTQLMQNNGYLHAHTEADTTHRAKRRIDVTYRLVPDTPSVVRSLRYNIVDCELNTDTIMAHTLLMEGDKLSINLLDDERKRITALLNDKGYYHFNKEFVTYVIDTVAGCHDVDITMNIGRYRANNNMAETSHPVYHIGKVRFIPGDSTGMKLRQSVLTQNTWLREGELYSASNLKQTYNNFSRMGAVRYTNIRLQPRQDTTLIDCDVQLMTHKPSSISFAPEGTNTAGDIGAAATLSYQHRNLMHGSELLSIDIRGAYEAIKGLDGYQNRDYVEYGAEVKLQTPRLMAPLISSSFAMANHATTEFALSMNNQNRPEFDRQVTRGTWRYKWNKVGDEDVRWMLDLLDINYIRMPRVSSTFKSEYLDDPTNRNAILRYNYQDLFIMRMGLTTTIRGRNNAIKVNVETAGNLLNAAMLIGGASKKGEDGQYRVFNVAYAQYAKADLDWMHLVKLNEGSELAWHVNMGVAVPYGNSTILPFEKRYFAGGANSVRGWSVRSLGPGSFRGTDGRIDFINQTGDVKLDMSMEYRTYLFWKFYGALFVDAGNIWTLRDYADQPGGQFRLDTFYKQIAVAYGMGVRMNFSYFFLRFDFGIKAINPAYETKEEHYAIIHPRLKRDLAFHFAVGLPF